MMAERHLGIPSLFLAFGQSKKRRGSDKSNATTPIISPAAAAEAVRREGVSAATGIHS